MAVLVKAETMFSYKFCWILFSLWFFAPIGFCDGNPIIAKFLENMFSKNASTVGFGNTSIIFLPLITAVGYPKDPSKILQKLGLDKFQTIYPSNNTEEQLADSISPNVQPMDCACEQKTEKTPDSTTQTSRIKYKYGQISKITTSTHRIPVRAWPDIRNLTGRELVSFWQAHKICTQNQMALPVVKNPAQYIALLPILDADKEYWIGLTRASSLFVTKYYWMDGDDNVNYLKHFNDLLPKFGPAEYCTIAFPNGKRTVAVDCKSESMKAHYACISEDFYLHLHNIVKDKQLEDKA